MYVIRIVDVPIPMTVDLPELGHWVRDMDFEAPRGRGHLVVTPDLARAKRFPDFEAAMNYWRTQSKTHPLRDDGKPNRPLTAYTVEIEKVAT